MKPSVPVFFVRHGQTASGALGRFQGHLDECLNEVGRIQSDQAAKRISEHLPGGIKLPVVSSPLRRATETAQRLHEGLPAQLGPITPDPLLCEMSFGTWEGMTTLEVKERFPEERRQRKRDRWRFSPPGGESFEQLASRVSEWLANCHRSMIVVTHSGIIRMVAHLLGDMAKEEAMRLEVPECSVWIWDRKRFYALDGLRSAK